MTTNRIASGLLSLVLLVLLGWCIIAGLGNFRTKLILGAGAVLGTVYTVWGRLPDWIIDHSGGSITHDDDPSNISPRIYLPILIGVIVIAIAVFVWCIWFL